MVATSRPLLISAVPDSVISQGAGVGHKACSHEIDCLPVDTVSEPTGFWGLDEAWGNRGSIARPA